MANKKGFTLIELIIVLVIIGIVVAVALPSIMTSIEQTKAQTAQNNLLTIAAAESKYYEDNSSVYCTNSGSSPNCGGSSQSLYSALGLSMTPNDNFTYLCWVSGTSYICTASDTTSGGSDTLKLNPTAQLPNHVVSCISVGTNLCPANLPSI